jgi:hypothetical protein
MVARCPPWGSGLRPAQKRRPAEAGLLPDCGEACAAPKPADSLGSRSGGRSSSVGSRSGSVGGRSGSVGGRSSSVGSRSVGSRSGSVGGRSSSVGGRGGSVGGRSGFFSSRGVGGRGFFSLVAGREGQDASGEEDVKLGVHAFLRRSCLRLLRGQATPVRGQSGFRRHVSFTDLLGACQHHEKAANGTCGSFDCSNLFSPVKPD